MKKINLITKLFTILIMLVIASSMAFAYETEISEEDNLQADNAYKRGLEFVQSEEYDAAIGAFRTALKYNPKMADAYYNIASIYVFQKKYDDAYSAYVKLISLKPDDYESILQVAKILYNKKDYAYALRYLKHIPESYINYNEVQQLIKDSNEMFDKQKKRIERSKITTAVNDKKVLIDDIDSPAGIVVDADGNMYIASYTGNSIIKIDKNNKKNNFVKDYLLEGPVGLAIDDFDNIYVANYDGNNVLKITKGGQVSVFMENISRPYFVYICNDILYISEQGNSAVLKYNLSSK